MRKAQQKTVRRGCEIAGGSTALSSLEIFLGSQLHPGIVERISIYAEVEG
jgi:hypothetical protein